MATLKRQPTGGGTGDSDGSTIFRMLGRHTNSVIVGALFTMTFIGFMVYICVFRDKLSDTLTTAFVGLLSSLIGFFIGSIKSN